MSVQRKESSFQDYVFTDRTRHKELRSRRPGLRGRVFPEDPGRLRSGVGCFGWEQKSSWFPGRLASRRPPVSLPEWEGGGPTSPKRRLAVRRPWRPRLTCHVVSATDPGTYGRSPRRQSPRVSTSRPGPSFPKGSPCRVHPTSERHRPSRTPAAPVPPTPHSTD